MKLMCSFFEFSNYQHFSRPPGYIMCYTVAINKKKEELEQRFHAAFDEAGYDPYYAVSGFLHPALPVILSDDIHKIQSLHWGLVPRWVKSREQASEIGNQTLNARGETILEKPSFRGAVLNNKCLVLVNGFYEWQKRGKEKQPYYIYMKNHEPFALGGLWDEWVDTETGEIRKTFSIITTPANALMSEIHNEKLRMPLIIPPGEEQRWLETKDAEGTQKWIHPFTENLLDAHPVSRLVNGRHGDPNVPEVQLPIEETPAQGSLF